MTVPVTLVGPLDVGLLCLLRCGGKHEKPYAVVRVAYVTHWHGDVVGFEPIAMLDFPDFPVIADDGVHWRLLDHASRHLGGVVTVAASATGDAVLVNQPDGIGFLARP